MRRVIERGGAVHVVWMTSGDGFPEGVETAEGISARVATQLTPQDYRNYGNLREQEARAAIASLGIGARSLTFLGFPDAGMCEPASKYLSAKEQERSLEVQRASKIDARASRKSSIFLGRIVSSMFMRVNSKCAHQVRPPLADLDGCRSPVAPTVVALIKKINITGERQARLGESGPRLSENEWLPTGDI